MMSDTSNADSFYPTVPSVMDKVHGPFYWPYQMENMKGAQWWTPEEMQALRDVLDEKDAEPDKLRARLAPALEALKMAYRKHHMGDDSIGWEELSEHMGDALCEAMGDQAFQDWLKMLDCPVADGSEDE